MIAWKWKEIGLCWVVLFRQATRVYATRPYFLVTGCLEPELIMIWLKYFCPLLEVVVMHTNLLIAVLSLNFGICAVYRSRHIHLTVINRVMCKNVLWFGCFAVSV